jgi:hypothetical protein
LSWNTQECAIKLELGRFFFVFGIVLARIRVVAQIFIEKSSSSSLATQEHTTKPELSLFGHEELRFFTTIGANS